MEMDSEAKIDWLHYVRRTVTKNADVSIYDNSEEFQCACQCSS